MAIDADLYAEGLVTQFQGWKKLKGPEAEAEVNKLLTLLETMSKVESPAVMDKLKVEWDALKAAKEKGFAEEASPGEPNSPANLNTTTAPAPPANPNAPAPRPNRPTNPRRRNTPGVEE